MADVRVLSESYQRSVLLEMLRIAEKRGALFGIAYVCVRDWNEPGYSIITAELQKGDFDLSECFSKAMSNVVSLMKKARGTRNLKDSMISIDSGIVTNHVGKSVIVGFVSDNDFDWEVALLGLDLLLQTIG